MPLVIQQVELVCVGKALLDKVVTNVLLDIIIIQTVHVSVSSFDGDSSIQIQLKSE